MNTAMNPAIDTPAAAAVKCVVWDLDDTVWSGILAEGDEPVLRPGMRDLLEALDQRGILHSVASRNDHGDAMAQLRRFGIDHLFVCPQIGWGAKSAAVGRIRQQLNIGTDTLLFVDDQPFERDEVASAHPELACMDAAEYATLWRHPRTSPAQITPDAAQRRLMYQQDLRRREDEEQFDGGADAFLATLGMKLVIADASHADLARAHELTLRTNQLNATGVSYDMAQLASFITSPRHRLLICELSDRYGSYGKIGLALVEAFESHDHIRLLLMSCRTASRGVGSVLLGHLLRQAAARGRRVRADFLRTTRNRQMLVTYQFAHFRQIAEDGNGALLFEHDGSETPKDPPYIQVRWA